MNGQEEDLSPINKSNRRSEFETLDRVDGSRRNIEVEKDCDTRKI